jgi:hypothetical protein
MPIAIAVVMATQQAIPNTKTIPRADHPRADRLLSMLYLKAA